MKNLTAREMVLCALFIALITAGTFVRIPMGGDVFTLQFLFTLLAGLVLGPRIGTLAVGAYVLLGLVGAPVFASGGGPGYLLEPTFGYLLGFILQAYACGKLSRRLRVPRIINLLGVNLIGMVIVYLIGVNWFYLVSNYVLEAPVAAWTVIVYSCVLQAPPDILLCVISAGLALRLHHAGIWLGQENNSSERTART